MSRMQEDLSRLAQQCSKAGRDHDTTSSELRAFLRGHAESLSELATYTAPRRDRIRVPTSWIVLSEEIERQFRALDAGGVQGRDGYADIGRTAKALAELVLDVSEGRP